MSEALPDNPVPSTLAHLAPERRLATLLGSGKHGTIATAESLTGGGVAARLTSVAGSSAYTLGGIVAYSNDAKMALLGVSQDILQNHGAVSSECAGAMASGARRAFDSTWAVATTGIAGPTGATDRKPVGLVYVAVAGPNGSRLEEHRFGGNRTAVTSASIDAALRLLLAEIGAGLSQKTRV